MNADASPRTNGWARLPTLAVWAGSATLGAWFAWRFRYSMNPDGISYLDMGDAESWNALASGVCEGLVEAG